MEKPWDAIVIGGGAAGLSAALMLGRSRRRLLVVDAGEPRNRFAAAMHGVLGRDGTDPAGLLARGREEVAGYGGRFRSGEVDRVEVAGAELTVVVAGSSERARTVIVASGLTDELPAIPGLAQRWGRSVLHCPYCHGWEVRDRSLGVLITSPLGVHQAELVRQLSAELVVFDPTGAVGPPAEERLGSRGVTVVREPVAELIGPGDQLAGVRLQDGTVIGIDALFTAGVARPHDTFLAGLGLERTEGPMGSFLAVDPTGRTSNQRVWAAGNVVNPGANVPVSISAGTLAGASANQALVAEDFDAAQGL